MNAIEERARDYVELMRRGRVDDAFHGLIDATAEILEPLEKCFRAEAHPAVRTAIVEVVSEFRKSESVSFLLEALADSEEAVWKAALHGLVTIGTTEAVAALEGAKRSNSPNKSAEFHKWLEEAIEQLKTSTPKVQI